MKRAIILFQIVLIVGCSSKSDALKKEERYLYFTSNFNSKYYWEISTTFESTSDNVACKDFSAGSGKWVQAKKYENHTLKKSGDTLKVPLFWAKTSPCSWRMAYLSTDFVGRRVRMNRISLKDKNTKDPLTEGLKPLPDSVAYACKIDTTEDALNCDVSPGEGKMDFLLNDSLKVSHLHVEITGP